jgi:uncharacterized protein (DUF1330 family)
MHAIVKAQSLALKSFEIGSSKPIVRATKGVALSGEEPKTISIFKFPSVEEALAFDSSPGYVALKATRDKSSNWRSYVVEGLPD